VFLKNLRKEVFFKQRFPKSGFIKTYFQSSYFKGFWFSKFKTNFKRDFVFNQKLFLVASLSCKKRDFILG